MKSRHDQFSKQPFDKHGRPRGLFAYWGWLLFRVDTEPIELFLSAVSSWWGLTLLGVTKSMNPEDYAPTLKLLTSVARLNLWIPFIVIIALAKTFGVLMRKDSLRFVGLLGSVGMWSTIAALNWHAFPASPVWGAYAIIAAFSSWAFIHRVLDASDPLTDRLRNFLRRGNDVRPESE
jgi:hypothetical protein